jgi:S-formylglutathione hydrolase FrmB
LLGGRPKASSDGGVSRHDQAVLSRRAFLGGAVGLVAGVGAAAAEFGPAGVRHRLGLLNSPDHRVSAGRERVLSGSFPSQHMHQAIGWSISVPTAAPIGVVFCLHSWGNDHTMAFSGLHIPDVVAASGAGLVVAACDGGRHSYWHPRADGSDAMAMFFEEFMPLVDREVAPLTERALLGWSMGGFGALLFAEQHPEAFRVVAAGSAALWTRADLVPSGPFDGAGDYHRWNVFDHTTGLSSVTVRVDCGTYDPFLSADRTFASRLPAGHPGSFTPGFHDFPYWRSIAPAQIATIAAVLHGPASRKR